MSFKKQLKSKQWRMKEFDLPDQIKEFYINNSSGKQKPSYLDILNHIVELNDYYMNEKKLQDIQKQKLENIIESQQTIIKQSYNNTQQQMDMLKEENEELKTTLSKHKSTKNQKKEDVQTYIEQLKGLRSIEKIQKDKLLLVEKNQNDLTQELEKHQQLNKKIYLDLKKQIKVNQIKDQIIEQLTNQVQNPQKDKQNESFSTDISVENVKDVQNSQKNKSEDKIKLKDNKKEKSKDNEPEPKQKQRWFEDISSNESASDENENQEEEEKVEEVIVPQVQQKQNRSRRGRKGRRKNRNSNSNISSITCNIEDLINGNQNLNFNNVNDLSEQINSMINSQLNFDGQDDDLSSLLESNNLLNNLNSQLNSQLSGMSGMNLNQLNDMDLSNMDLGDINLGDMNLNDMNLNNADVNVQIMNMQPPKATKLSKQEIQTFQLVFYPSDWNSASQMLNVKFQFKRQKVVDLKKILSKKLKLKTEQILIGQKQILNIRKQKDTKQISQLFEVQSFLRRILDINKKVDNVHFPIFSYFVIENILKCETQLVAFKLYDQKNYLGTRIIPVKKDITYKQLYLLIFKKIRFIIRKRNIGKSLKKKINNKSIKNEQLLQQIKDKYFNETLFQAGFFELIFKSANLKPTKKELEEFVLDIESDKKLLDHVEKLEEQQQKRIIWCIEVIVSAKYIKKLPDQIEKNFENIF